MPIADIKNLPGMKERELDAAEVRHLALLMEEKS